VNGSFALSATPLCIRPAKALDPLFWKFSKGKTEPKVIVIACESPFLNDSFSD
jgi:hypothetical protein